MLKVGDIVRHKAGTAYYGDAIWGFQGQIELFTPHGGTAVIRMLDGPQQGRSGGFNTCDLELVDVNKSLSDQELADKYRKLRSESTDIADELTRRGYTSQYNPMNQGWFNFQPRTKHDEYRFIKMKEIVL